jgi:hypothetical protein
MTKRRWLAAAAIAALCVTTSVAKAASNRVWVSGHGVDQVGCGAPTAPCRSLQYAHDNAVIAGGEIDILDPAGYGAITITKSISIVNDGVGTAGVQATSGNAITIEAGPTASVYLRGLNVDGVLGSASNGIEFDSGKGLTILNCVVRHFAHDGISLAPLSGLPVMVIASTISSDNGHDGISYMPASGAAATELTVDQVLVNNNNNLGLETSPGGGGFLEIAISNTIADENQNGIFIDDNVVASIDLTRMQMNAADGLEIENGATVLLSRSVPSQNGAFGVENIVGVPGSIYSAGDNRIYANQQGATNGPAMIALATQ